MTNRAVCKRQTEPYVNDRAVYKPLTELYINDRQSRIYNCAEKLLAASTYML